MYATSSPNSSPFLVRWHVMLISVCFGASALFILYNAENYLFSSSRWLVFCAGVLVATTVLWWSFRSKIVATYMTLSVAAITLGLYGAETALAFKQSKPFLMDLGNPAPEEQMRLIRSAAEQGRRVRPLLSLDTLLMASGDDDAQSDSDINSQEIIKLGSLSRVDTLVFDPVALRWTESATDRYGHLNDDDIWGRREIDILVVGASHTQGGGARFGRDFVSLLDGYDYTVARLGLGGIGGLSKLGMLREFGRQLRPQIVFWMYADRNDLESDLERELANPILARYLDPEFHQNLPDRIGQIDDRLDRLILEKLNLREKELIDREDNSPVGVEFSLVPFLKLNRIRQRLGLSVGTPVTETRIQDWTRILSLAKTEVEDWGGSLVFVYLPMWGTLHTRSEDPFKLDVLDATEAIGIPLIDFSAELLAQPDPTAVLRTADGRVANHYNEQGHHLIAERLKSYLEP